MESWKNALLDGYMFLDYHSSIGYNRGISLLSIEDNELIWLFTMWNDNSPNLKDKKYYKIPIIEDSPQHKILEMILDATCRTRKEDPLMFDESDFGQIWCSLLDHYFKLDAVNSIYEREQRANEN